MTSSSLAKFVSFGPLRGTRYPELVYQKQGNRWRLIDTSSDRTIGPLYTSQAELLADVDRVAELFGCN